MPASSDNEQRVAVLHEHYKDSIEKQCAREKTRTRLLLGILALLGLLSLHWYNPQESVAVAQQVSQKYINVQLDPIAIGSLLWGLLVINVHGYYQLDLQIERAYPYIHQLEDRIGELIQEQALFGREGKHYLKNYPLFSAWSWWLYKAILPIIVLGMMTHHILYEYQTIHTTHNLLMLDSLCFISASISLFLYLWQIHRESLQDLVKLFMNLLLKPTNKLIHRLLIRP